MIERITDHLCDAAPAAAPRGGRRPVPPGPAGALLIAAALVASAACQSSSTNVIGPSGTKCAMTLPSSLPTIGADGGSGTLTVTVAPECVWSASSAAEWVSITSSPGGQGTGTLTFAAAGNPTALVRRGALVVGERRVELTQSGAACRFTLTPQTASVPASGGDGAITLNAVEGCPWTATSQADWIAIVGNQTGSGSATVHFAAGANDGPARSGLIAIADRSFAVNQAASGSACGISLDDPEHVMPASGGSHAVTVRAVGDCTWTAVSQAAWISVSSGATGRGTATVTLSVAANAGAARVGLVTIGGQTLVVSQTAGTSSGCAYSLASTAFSAPAAGGATAIGVTAPAGCAWTASSAAPWISVVAGAVANGSGAATLAIAANTGAARSASILVAGQTFTVNQAAAPSAPACTYDLSESEQSVGALGGSATIGVTAGNGCAWTATSQAGWITIAGGASGSGNGTVSLAVALNAGSARSGTVVVAGRTHTITQASGLLGCTFSLDPTDATSGTAGGTIQVAVTAGLTCAWQAQSNAPWITVTSGATGLANGTVRLAVAANGGAQRVGVVTIAGQTFTITQAPAPASCTYTLNPSTQAVGPLGGDFSVAITTQAGCTWSAATSDGWIQLLDDTTGAGSGRVSYRIGLGLLFSRSGRITIGGQALTVNQAALLLSNAR
jgi:hypothetical protein